MLTINEEGKLEKQFNKQLRKDTLGLILTAVETLNDALELIQDQDLEFEEKTEKQINRIINKLNDIDTYYCKKFNL